MYCTFYLKHTSTIRHIHNIYERRKYFYRIFVYYMDAIRALTIKDIDNKKDYISVNYLFYYLGDFLRISLNII